MKIISTFKDYYDFMVHKYGVDPKIVYTRVPEEKEVTGIWGKTGMWVPDFLKYPDRCVSFDIHFCGKVYYVYFAYGDWFFGEAVADINKEKYPHFTSAINPIDNHALIKQWIETWKPNRYSWHYKDEKIHGGPSLVNEKLECPVVISDRKNPRLSDFIFGSVIPPEDAFITISNWLSREKPVLDYQTDKEKIISHGFDNKTSFRKM